MNRPKRITLGAGGTGGHMFPAQALAEQLVEQGWEVSLVTDARGEKLSSGIPAIHKITVGAATLSPRMPHKIPAGLWRLMQGVRQASAHIKAFQPDVVAGFGGYPAFPAMMAARRLKLPIVLHEQNAVLGRVNRVFAKRAEVLASGFGILERLPRGANWVVTGNPLRDIFSSHISNYKKPTIKGRVNLLVVGGSLGARLLSETVPEAVAMLPKTLRSRLNVVQQTREESLSFATTAYKDAGVTAECAPFFSDIPERLAEAHLVIARAGASSVSELAFMGRPSILVPLAIAMDNHQEGNAMSLVEAGAADMVRESELTAQRLSGLLESRLSDSNGLAAAAAAAKSTARPDAALKLAELVINLVEP